MSYRKDKKELEDIRKDLNALHLKYKGNIPLRDLEKHKDALKRLIKGNDPKLRIDGSLSSLIQIAAILAANKTNNEAKGTVDLVDNLSNQNNLNNLFLNNQQNVPQNNNQNNNNNNQQFGNYF
ncbi:hypothetical protein AVM71_13540 [Piscirickettsia salmonis]|nr:hypothetical protein AVM71_13540 [Piscirickettsia salmonis]